MEVFATIEASLRAPWQDELPRLKTFLRGAFSEHRSPAQLRVLTAKAPERILGAVALGMEENSFSAHAVLRLRQRARVAGFTPRLIDAIRDLAVERGAQRVSIVLDSWDPLGEALRDAGYSATKTEEVWRLELAAMRNRLDRLAKRFGASAEWSVRAPVEGDLDAARALIAPYGFRDPSAVRFSTTSEGPGYNLRLSTVVEQQGATIAVLLVQASHGLCGHVDVRAVAKSHLNESGALNFLMLQRSVNVALADGYQQTTLTVNTERDHETRRLAERTGGTLVMSKTVWELAL